MDIHKHLPSRAPEVASEAAHRIIEDFIRRSRIPGLSIAIVDRHGPLFTAGSDWADLATGDPATPETRYLWFSLTKIVTATAALASPTTVPSISTRRSARPCGGGKHPRVIRDGAPAAQPHRRVPQPGSDPVGAPRTARAVAPEDLLDRLLRKRGADTTTGGGPARYSKLGYLVLGSVIEAAAQRPFTSYVRETILGPLGLTGTDFTHVEPRLAATGYVKAPRAVAPLLRAVLPGGIVGSRTGAYQALHPFYVEGPSYGGLVGSVLDAGRFATAHLDDGALGGTRILRADTTRRMRHIDTPGKKIDVGQGWFRKAEHRISTPPHVEHLGAGGGFFNVMRLYLVGGLGFVVMANTTSPYPTTTPCSTASSPSQGCDDPDPRPDSPLTTIERPVLTPTIVPRAVTVSLRRSGPGPQGRRLACAPPGVGAHPRRLTVVGSPAPRLRHVAHLSPGARATRAADRLARHRAHCSPACAGKRRASSGCPF